MRQHAGEMRTDGIAALGKHTDRCTRCRRQRLHGSAQRGVLWMAQRQCAEPDRLAAGAAQLFDDGAMLVGHGCRCAAAAGGTRRRQQCIDLGELRGGSNHQLPGHREQIFEFAPDSGTRLSRRPSLPCARDARAPAVRAAGSNPPPARPPANRPRQCCRPATGWPDRPHRRRNRPGAGGDRCWTCRGPAASCCSNAYSSTVPEAPASTPSRSAGAAFRPLAAASSAVCQSHSRHEPSRVRTIGFSSRSAL